MGTEEKNQDLTGTTYKDVFLQLLHVETGNVLTDMQNTVAE